MTQGQRDALMAGEMGKESETQTDEAEELKDDFLSKRFRGGEIEEVGLKLEGHVLGLTPVQGEGLLDGKPWYFRARYEYWTFTMAEEGGDVHRVRSMLHNAAQEDGWNIERDWPFGEFSAGYMPFKAARANILTCARMYWAGKLPRVRADLAKYAEESRELEAWSDRIRAASYCECDHNQPQHGITREKEVAQVKARTEVKVALEMSKRHCEVCACENFRYSSEKSNAHHKEKE